MREINKFFDDQILPFYGDGKHLDTDDIPETKIKEIIDLFMRHDTSVRDYVLAEIQDIIDQRMDERESDKLFEDGFRTIRLSNGDVSLHRSRVF